MAEPSNQPSSILPTCSSPRLLSLVLIQWFIPTVMDSYWVFWRPRVKPIWAYFDNHQLLSALLVYIRWLTSMYCVICISTSKSSHFTLVINHTNHVNLFRIPRTKSDIYIILLTSRWRHNKFVSKRHLKRWRISKRPKHKPAKVTSNNRSREGKTLWSVSGGSTFILNQYIGFFLVFDPLDIYFEKVQAHSQTGMHWIGRFVWGFFWKRRRRDKWSTNLNI